MFIWNGERGGELENTEEKGGEKKRGMWASVNGGEWETKGKVVGVILLLEPVALTLTVA